MNRCLRIDSGWILDSYHENLNNIKIIKAITLCMKCMFQFFLSNRAVYLLLWNVRLGSEHAGLDFWLNSIACHAPKASVFVVGTHCDKVGHRFD